MHNEARFKAILPIGGYQPPSRIFVPLRRDDFSLHQRVVVQIKPFG